MLHKCECTFKAWFIFNENDVFGGYWGDQEYYIADLWVWAAVLMNK